MVEESGISPDQDLEAPGITASYIFMAEDSFAWEEGILISQKEASLLTPMSYNKLVFRIFFYGPAGISPLSTSVTGH